MKNTLFSISLIVVIVMAALITSPVYAGGDPNNHQPLPGTTPIHSTDNLGNCIDQYIAAGLYPNAISNGWNDGLCGHAPVAHCGNVQVERRNPWFAFKHGCTDVMPDYPAP